MKRQQSVLLSALLAAGMIAAILSGCAPRLPVPIPATSTPTVQPTPSIPPEVRIGVVYPLSGRLEEWGQEALPFIQMAEADVNDLPEARTAGWHFRFVARSTGTTVEGALAATKDLVEREGTRVLVGFPMSWELAGSMDYLTQQHVAVVSSASTAPLPELLRPDTVYRISPPELYLARTYARFALHLGYRKAALIYRTDGWGERYAAEFAAQFQAQGYPTAMVPIEPTHPHVRDYAAEVSQLSARVAELGADQEMVVFTAVWEGEDLNILHHAAQDATLSRVRWLAALLYPSLFTGQWPASGFDFPDARDFAFAHAMWGQEAHPPLNNLVRRLWTQASAELGREPRYEHVYLYDACQIAARAVMRAGTDDGDAVAAAIPAVVQDYSPATGIIRLDANGDRNSGDLAYYGLFQGEQGWEYRYYAYYDATTDHFLLLVTPEEREIQFCPEC